MKKKILSLALAILMILSLVPTMALADSVSVATQEELNTQLGSAAAGTVVEITVAGTYTLANIVNNITVKGAEGINVVFNCVGSGSICSIPSGASFENVSFNMGAADYHGFQHAGKIVMKNCIINGLFFSYSDMDFIGCTFNAPGTDASGISGTNYSMWAYGGNLLYKDCTFNCAGKCINFYNENNTDTPWIVKAEGCTFNSSVTNKAAFNVKERSGETALKYDVQVAADNKIGEGEANSNFPGFNIADNAERTLVINEFVQIDDRLENGSGEGEQITVSVGGDEIYTSPAANETYVDAAKEAACNIIDAALGENPSDAALALAAAQKESIMKEESITALTEATNKAVAAVEKQIEEDNNPKPETEPQSDLEVFLNKLFGFLIMNEMEENMKAITIFSIIANMFKTFLGFFAVM